MKILWYNVWSYPFLTSNNHINRVVNYIFKSVREHNLDVITLGELFDGATRNAIKKQLCKGLPEWKVVPRGEEISWLGQQSGGLLAMYRESGFSLVKAHYHILSSGAMQDRFAAKGVMGLRFMNHSGTALWLCLTHLQDPDAGFSRLCMWKTQKQFAEVLDIVGVNGIGWTTGEDVIVFGDFNVNPIDAANIWVNSDTSMKLLQPLTATHSSSNEILDYGLTSYQSDKKVNMALIDNEFNPSDHRAICITVTDFGHTSRAHLNHVPNLSLEIHPLFLFIMCIYLLWITDTMLTTESSYVL